MNNVSIDAVPADLSWLNQPGQADIEGGNSLQIVAGAETDWFVDPAGGVEKRSAPIALFTPPDKTCLLSAVVTVDFASTFDAGVLFVYLGPDRWAKLCFEYSPQQRPGIVSVVTRGLSDDCNSVLIHGNTVHLRIYRQDNVLAFHHSTDGQYWHFVRYFTFGPSDNLQLGFSAQSPSGRGCTVQFTHIHYEARALPDLRDGR